MTSVLRIAGVLMMVAGGLLMASWFIEPLRALWPWLVNLPLPVRLGLAVSALGLSIVLATVVHDRLRADDRSLREEPGEDS